MRLTIIFVAVTVSSYIAISLSIRFFSYLYDEASNLSHPKIHRFKSDEKIYTTDIVCGESMMLSNPKNTRTFNAAFHNLYIALQRFYNFDNYHLSEFNLGKKQNVTFDGETEEVDALLEVVLIYSRSVLYACIFYDYLKI